MRLAVFTSQYPGRVNTFFARDMRALSDAGIEIEIFPLYPLDQGLWRYVPDILNDRILPRDKVHHLTNVQSLLHVSKMLPRVNAKILPAAARAAASSVRFGTIPFMKTGYAISKAMAWANSNRNGFDHILAYWGNYSATSAYFFNQLVDHPPPFSMFLHAGTDLYRDQVFLRQKLISAHNIIVVCDFNKRFIRRLFPDIYDEIKHKIYLHHLGLDLETFSFKPDGRPTGKVLAVGNFDKRKGFDYLLQAASELSKRRIRIHLEFIGQGDEEQHLRNLARQLQIEERVMFRGWVPFDEVQRAMKSATMLVHPSVGLGDAVPTVIKEAMALGTPVIASNAVGIPELLDDGNCGVLVPPKNAKVLAHAIESLLKNNNLRQMYAHTARRFAEEKFDLWRNGKALADLLRTRPEV